MCGIIGAFHRKDASQIVIEGFSIIKERGKDGAGLFDGTQLQHGKTINQLRKTKSKNTVGHVLHAIVNTVSQPIVEKDHSLIANCEIYNWKELNRKYELKAENDSILLLRLLIKFGVKKTISLLRGVYAFCYWHKNDVYLVRDIIGIKPIWYSAEKGLVFCSERKGIEQNATNIVELNPRTVLKYDILKDTVSFSKRAFFSLKESRLSEKKVVNQLTSLLKESVKIRIPNRKFGLLLSGGIDSIILAKILKGLGATFTCYIASTDETKSEVLIAKKIAKELDLDLRSTVVYEEKIDFYLKEVVPLIEDSNVVKVGVATTFHIACEQARRDGCKVIFSGSGADELFAGYYRYKNQTSLKNLNKDCYSDILKFYEKNSYRDDVISMNKNLELRVPYLDSKLVAIGLNIPSKLKIKKEKRELTEKYILRKVGEKLGLPTYVTTRKKKAAQYGSGIDKAITKAAKKGGYKSKSAYLDTFLPKKIMKLGALISGGKDSWYAAHIMKQQNYDISCLITLKSKNKSSYMFHTPNIDLVSLQSKTSGIPLVEQNTKGEKEKELVDLEKAIRKAKEKYGIEGVVSGALYSNYQRERIEKICDELNLKIFSPLWHIDQELEMRNLLKEGFEITLSAIGAEGLDKTWLGVPITNRHIDTLVQINKKIGINIAGEGGEFESFVLDCPLFEKKIKITKKRIIQEQENIANLKIEEAKIVKKSFPKSLS